MYNIIIIQSGLNVAPPYPPPPPPQLKILNFKTLLVYSGRLCRLPRHVALPRVATNPDLTRARRALSLFNDVPFRTRRTLLLYKVYGDRALLVFNGMSLNIVNALLVIIQQNVSTSISHMKPQCLKCEYLILMLKIDSDFYSFHGYLKFLVRHVGAVWQGSSVYDQ